jgi:hypothetical protein
VGISFSEVRLFRLCGGKETDLLAIFEAKDFRFALHFEVKHPGDSFKAEKQQSKDYRIRATCWIGKTPKHVLAHQDAETILICSPERLPDFAVHASHFDRFISIEDISKAFPGLLPRNRLASPERE